MSTHIPEFYESIVEASKRGELWGLDQFANNSNQLEINFDHSVYNGCFDKINPLSAEDRKLICDLNSIYNLESRNHHWSL